MLYFSYVLQRATILNNEVPSFTKLKDSLNTTNILNYKEEIEQILKKYGDENTYQLYQIPYKQYQNKLTQKMEEHYEYIFYIKKAKKIDLKYINS